MYSKFPRARQNMQITVCVACGFSFVFPTALLGSKTHLDTMLKDETWCAKCAVEELGHRRVG